MPTNLVINGAKALYVPKESLYGISKKYGVTVDELKKWNNLASDHIQTGQQLIISK
jgi:membrane-bound lytic murein transglycosylase D